MSSSTSPIPTEPLKPEEVLAEIASDGKAVRALKRVLWVNPVQRTVVLFDLVPEIRLRKPYWADLDDVEGRLRTGEYRGALAASARGQLDISIDPVKLGPVVMLLIATKLEN